MDNGKHRPSWLKNILFLQHLLNPRHRTGRLVDPNITESITQRLSNSQAQVLRISTQFGPAFADRTFSAVMPIATNMLEARYEVSSRVILVMTCYAERMKLIRRMFLQFGLEVRTRTVDSEQGQQSPFLNLDLIDPGSSDSRGFVAEPRRLNMTLPRAEEGLIIIGNQNVVARRIQSQTKIRGRE